MIRVRVALILIVALFLTACSGMRVIDTDVTAFSAWTSAPPVPGTRYRFERLPSQQSANAQQDRIEALATTSLSKVGMVLSPPDARYSVQVLLVTEIVQRYPETGFGFGGPGFSIAGGSRGSSIGLSFPIGFGDPYYKRSLSMLMRELSSQKVVFETRALHDGPWGDAFAILPAMLDSALQGFPQPPAGLRRINAEIPR
jgi:hypothetical protein